MNCCKECFLDENIRRQIRKLRSSKQKCDQCGSQNANVVTAEDLRQIFDNVCGAYQPSPDGIPLYESLKRDWAIFNVPDKEAKPLLQVIGSSVNVDGTHSPFQVNYPDGKELWDEFRIELKEANRFFFETNFWIKLNRLDDLFFDLVVQKGDIQSRWYRARIQKNGMWCDSEMRMPPKGLAKAGRANPVGIPYLYLGYSQQNVINEVKPQVGNKVTIVTFSLSETVRIIDLRNPKMKLSPFNIDQIDDVAELREDVSLIEVLNSELSKPINREKSDVDYLPSQYLCEFIKRRGYDGVVYRSASGYGANLALFSENLVKLESGKTVSTEVTKINIEFHNLA